MAQQMTVGSWRLQAYCQTHPSGLDDSSNVQVEWRRVEHPSADGLASGDARERQLYGPLLADDGGRQPIVQHNTVLFQILTCGPCEVLSVTAGKHKLL